MPFIKICSLLLLVYVFRTAAVERSSIFRFHHLLKRYDYPDYRASDRDIYNDFQYSADLSERSASYSTLSYEGMDVSQYSLDFSDTLGFAWRSLHSSAVRQYEHTLSVYAAGSIQKRSDETENSMTGFYESRSEEMLRGRGMLHYTTMYRRYNRISFLNDRLFAECRAITWIHGQYIRERIYNKDMNRNRDSTSILLKTRKNGDGSFTLFPVVGFGKRVPVAPMYKAFEIQRKLKRTGVVREKLSDSTLMRLARLVGSLESFKLRNDRYDKYLMKELETIVSADSAVDTARLNAFALFKAYETFSEQMPLLFTGFEVTLGVSGWLTYDQQIYYQNHPDPYSRSMNYWNSPGFGFNLDVRHPLRLSWTLPIVSRFFFELGIRPPYFYSDSWFNYATEVGAYYFITNRVLLHGSVSDIPSYIAVPRSLPQRYDLEMTVYLEDHLSLSLHGFRDSRFISSGQQDKRIEEGITMRVNYDF